MIGCAEEVYSKDDSRGFSNDREARDMVVDSFVDQSYSYSLAARRGIRRGVRSRMIPDVWLKANKLVPLTYSIDIDYFNTSGSSVIEDSKSSLTADGIDIKRRLILSIPHFFSYVEFCPFLTPLTEALLCFHDLPETAIILSRFLSRIKTQESRIFMFCKWTSFKEVVAFTFAYLSKKFPKSPFLLPWLADHLSDGCARLFPFGLFVRMAGCVLFEGCKVISRYLLAAVSLSGNLSTAEELTRAVRAAAGKRGKEIGKIAFQLSLSFRGVVGLADPSATLSVLERTNFQFFGEGVEYEGFGKILRFVDPLISVRKFSTAFKAKSDGFSNRLFQLKLREASNFVLIVTTKHAYRGFYLIDDVRYMFDETRIIGPIERDQVAKFTDGRFFIGGLLTIDGEMKEAAGSSFASSGEILDLELILV